jgi:CcmD family protein
LTGLRSRAGGLGTGLAVVLATGILCLLVTPAAPSAAAGQPQIQQDEFVPIDELPPQDQLPAAPLLVAAYAIVWLVVMGYLWTIRTRQATVEREIAQLTRRSGAD